MIDIMMPTYRAARFIEDAVDSCSGQLGDRLSIVGADGGSQDGTREVLERHAVRFVSSPDSGQSEALNRALGLVRTPWAGWLNADEFYMPWVSKVLSEVLVLSDADVIYGDCVFVDSAGGLLRMKAQHSFSSGVLRDYGCFISSCAAFFRVDMLRRVGGFDERAVRAMDWEMYLRLQTAGATFRYVPIVLGAFRIHADQVTASKVDVRRSEEQRMIRSTYALPMREEWSWRLRRGVAYARHAGLKAVEGGHRRELGSIPSRGVDLRWFAPHHENGPSVKEHAWMASGEWQRMIGVQGHR